MEFIHISYTVTFDNPPNRYYKYEGRPCTFEKVFKR